MFKDLAKLKEERNELQSRVDAIIQLAKEDNRELSAAEKAEVDDVIKDGGRLDAINKDIAREERLENIRQVRAAELAAKDDRLSGKNRDEAGDRTYNFTLPRSEYRYTPKNFAGPTAREDAYLAGRWAAATIHKHQDSMHWLDKHGFEVQASGLNTTDNASAGFLVPEVLEANIIRHLEGYGKFRANVGAQKPIVGGTWKGPRALTGLTVYYPGEGTAGTISTPTFGMIQLKVNDAVAYTTVSRNLDQDAIAQLGDNLVLDFARAYAKAEDEAGFLGDGTATYGGMVGLKNALAAGCDVTATSETTFGALTRERFESCVGALPDWPGIMPKWYISKPGYYASMARLQMAAGGNAVIDLGNGPVLQYLGYPVVFVPALPKALTSLTGQRVAYFGDLSYAAVMGTARGLSIESDMSKYFLERLIAVQCYSRFDINIYEVGDASNAGGMIALKMG